MKRIQRLATIAIALLCAIPAFVAAQQPYSLSQVQNIRETYDASIETSAVETATVAGKRQSTGTWGVGFSAGLSGDYANRAAQHDSIAGTTLTYFLRDAAGRDIVDAGGAPDGSGLITGAGGQGRFAFEYLLVIPQGQAVAAGTYTDVVTATLYRDGTATVDDTADFTITITVSDTVAVAVTNPGGTYESGTTAYPLNLGVLDTGVSSSADLIVRANVGYAVSVESTNAGTMVDSTAPVQTPIPYTLAVNGTPYALDAGVVEVASSGSATTLTGDRWVLSFTVGDVSAAEYGSYADTLTVVVTTVR